LRSEWLSELANLVKVGCGYFCVTPGDRLWVWVPRRKKSTSVHGRCVGQKGRYGPANREREEEIRELNRLRDRVLT
jgi:hypothetical protein